jgi:hypothetical protein
MYGYGYSYPSSIDQSAGLVFANAQYNLLSARVTADGGTLVDRNFTTNLYRLFFDQFAGVVPRRVYSSNAAVKLNDLGGGSFGVQAMYDLNNVSPVDAIQTTAANQPVWTLDATIGRSVPLFDGSNDFMPVNDLGIFNAQTAGTLLAVANDINPNAGDTAHSVIDINTITSGSSRAGILTRIGSVSQIDARGRRLDADAGVSSVGTFRAGYNYLANLSVWGGNLITLQLNATHATSNTYASGGGVTSATNSANFTIGASNATPASRLNGYITDIIADRTVFTTAQLTALRTFYKQYNSNLP